MSNRPQTRSNEGIGHLRTGRRLSNRAACLKGANNPPTSHHFTRLDQRLVFLREYTSQIELQPTQDPLQLIHRDVVLAPFDAVERGVRQANFPSEICVGEAATRLSQIPAPATQNFENGLIQLAAAPPGWLSIRTSVCGSRVGNGPGRLLEQPWRRLHRRPAISERCPPERRLQAAGPREMPRLPPEGGVPDQSAAKWGSARLRLGLPHRPRRQSHLRPASPPPVHPATPGTFRQRHPICSTGRTAASWSPAGS